MGRFHMTPLAARHVRKIARDSQAQWGKSRAITYIAALQASFQHIADRHDAIPKRTRLTGRLNLRLHRTGSHYIAFVVLNSDHVAITSILHERMDVSTRLQELQARTDKQVGDIRAQILRDQFKGG